MLVRIFRHVACEGPGYLADVLARHRIPYDVVAIDQGEPVAKDLSGVSGLVFMGGPMSVNDPIAWVDEELQLIRRAVAAGVPILGHCLGGQLISKALGGLVTANPCKEIGWHPVTAVNSAVAEAWLGDLPTPFDAFHWHGETFSVPVGAVRLLTSQHCENQAFAIGDTLALQCHVEMKADMVSEWAALYAGELAEPSPLVQSAAEMTRNLDTRIEALHKAADRLYGRWLKPLLRG